MSTLKKGGNLTTNAARTNTRTTNKLNTNNTKNKNINYNEIMRNNEPLLTIIRNYLSNQKNNEVFSNKAIATLGFNSNNIGNNKNKEELIKSLKNHIKYILKQALFWLLDIQHLSFSK